MRLRQQVEHAEQLLREAKSVGETARAAEQVQKKNTKKQKSVGETARAAEQVQKKYKKT